MKLKVLRPALAPIGKRRQLSLLGAAFGDNDFVRCRIVVAFAKRGGVRRLLPHIEPFRAKGHTVSVVVGVDVRGTSTEALQLLLASVDDAYVTYDPDPRCTFHPKMFLFDGPKRALAFVGSHNMTAGGLELNYEAGVAVDLDLPADGVTWTKGFEASWTELMPAVHPSTAPLTQLLIDDLVAAGLVVSEAQLQKERTAVKAAAVASGVKLPFVSAGVAPATVVAAAPTSPATAPVKASAAPPVKVAAAAAPAVPAPRRMARVAHRWTKELSRADAQHPASGTSPTGHLTLVQAGHGIDQATYFRTSLFGSAPWTPAPRGKEESYLIFDVHIRGAHLGTERIRLSHTPSFEAGQHNRTTVLHWGPLGDHLRQTDLTGDYVSLEVLDDGSYRLTIDAAPTGPFLQ